MWDSGFVVVNHYYDIFSVLIRRSALIDAAFVGWWQNISATTVNSFCHDIGKKKLYIPVSADIEIVEIFCLLELNDK